MVCKEIDTEMMTKSKKKKVLGAKKDDSYKSVIIKQAAQQHTKRMQQKWHIPEDVLASRVSLGEPMGDLRACVRACVLTFSLLYSLFLYTNNTTLHFQYTIALRNA